MQPTGDEFMHSEANELPFDVPYKLLQKKDEVNTYTAVILYDPVTGRILPLPDCPDGLRARTTFAWTTEGTELDEALRFSVTSEIAEAMGLSGTVVKDLIMDPDRYMSWFLEYVLSYLVEDSIQNKLLLSDFCVLYLPELVDLFLKPPFLAEGEDRAQHINALWNVYTWMLIRLSTNPYFAQYMTREDSRGEELLVVLMACLSDELSAYAETFQEELDDPQKPSGPYEMHVFDFFLTLLELRDPPLHAKITIGTISPILAFFDEWGERAKEEAMRGLCNRISSTLKRLPSFMKAAENERQMLLRMQECVQPGCGKRTDLYSCGRVDGFINEAIGMRSTEFFASTRRRIQTNRGPA